MVALLWGDQPGWLARPSRIGTAGLSGLRRVWFATLSGWKWIERLYEDVGVVDDIEQIYTAAAKLADAGLRALPERELLDGLDLTQRAMQALAVLRCHLMTQIESRDITAAYSTTAAWLRDQLMVDLPEAKQIVTQATELGKYPEVERALIRGDINTKQATVICETLDDLPAELDQPTKEAAQHALLDFASTHPAGTLHRLAARILDHVAPHLAERNERAALEAQEKRAQRRRGLHLAVPHDGSVRISGFLSVHDAAIVNAAFDPLCVPRPGDERTMTERRADALIDVCELALRTRSLPDTAGEPAHVVVTIPLETLIADNPVPPRGWASRAQPRQGGAARPGQGGPARPGRGGSWRPDQGGSVRPREGGSVRPSEGGSVRPREGGSGRPGEGGSVRPREGGLAQQGSAVLDTGEHITAETARRIACNALIIPAVLDTVGQPLDIGRSRRLFTGPLRRALALRDRGCAFPDCDKPPRWCHGHHLRHWAQGGPTSLTNPRSH